MKKILTFLFILLSVAAMSQTLYVPNNPDSIKVPVQIMGVVRYVYVKDLLKNANSAGSYNSVTSLSDSAFTLNRPNGTKDTITFRDIILSTILSATDTINFDATQLKGVGSKASPLTLVHGISYATLGADFSTTSNTPVAAGISSDSLAIGSYEFEVMLFVGTNAAAGMQAQLTTSGTIAGGYEYMARASSANAITTAYFNTFNTLSTAFNTQSATNGYINYKGIISVTSDKSTLSLSVQAGTSATATVKQFSYLKLTRIN